MLIILEGVDCSGKSTFAERLADRIKRGDPDADVTIIHRGVPSAHPLDEYVAPLLDYRPGTDRHIICDRWHVGEIVYPMLYERRTEMTEDVRVYVEAFLRSRGAFLALSSASTDDVHACATARDESPQTVQNLVAAAELFQRYVARTSLARVVVPMTDPDEDYVTDVIGLANDEDWFTEHLNPFKTYVGPARPLLLLFGDRRGPASSSLTHQGQWPAFAPRASTSGRWLLTTLLSAPLTVPSNGILLNNVGIANACDVDDPAAIWKAVDRPPVVALGWNASRALEEADVPHRSVPHPQYFRRFKHNDRREYFDRIFNPQTQETA